MHGNAIKLMLLTGSRRAEAGGLRRSELQNGDWYLPAERSKNKRPHVVPLADLAREVINNVPQIDGSDLVFTLDGKSAVSGWSRNKERLDNLIGTARATGENYDPALHDPQHWTFHDLRRTLLTGMIEHLGIAPHVLEATIGHVSGASRAEVAGAYNRSVLPPQRREALAAWAEYIERIVTGAEPANNVARIKTAG